MPALTLGFTGMDASTESELRSAFERALPSSGGGWQLVPDTHADYVVVDMDSMYGPMSWLRLHAAGKQVVGLTGAPRTQTPYRLARPVQADELSALLRDIRVAAGIHAVPAAEAAAVASPSAAAAPVAAAPGPVASAPVATATAESSRPSGMTPSPEPADELPVERPAGPVSELPSNPEAITEPARASDEPPSAAVAQLVPPAPSMAPAPATPASGATAAPRPAAPPAPARSAEPQTLAEWLASGRLRGRLRYAADGAAVLVDAEQRLYFGPALLKPIAPLFARSATLADFEPVSPDVWNAQTTAMGAAQPLARLVWFGALLAGGGRIVAGYDPDDRFRLTKWPQTEREFPKHFRIATAMMKGPATIGEIAEASHVPASDVADFVNASLATGFAEPYREPEPEPETTRSGGLFGRFKGR